MIQVSRVETRPAGRIQQRSRTDRLWRLDTFGVHALRIYDLQERRFREVPLPAGTFVSLGSITPVLWVEGPGRFRIEVEGLGAVELAVA